MSLFQRSSLTFGEAKTWVAEQHNKQTSPEMLLRAGRAIQRAVKDWNRYKWEWLITEGPAITVTGGLTNTKYPVPYNYRDMYSLVFTQAGIPRALVQDTKRGYDRVSPNPIASVSTGYNLVRIGDLGKFELQDPPNAGGTIKMLYYRRMVVPCTVSAILSGTYPSYNITADSLAGVYPGNKIFSAAGGFVTQQTIVSVESPTAATLDQIVGLLVEEQPAVIGGDDQFLDIHQDFEWALLARACEHFLVSVGASETKLGYWMGAATKGIEDALAAQADKDDRELCFEPLPHFGTYNPNRIVE